MKLTFSKYEGCGNDFILVDNRSFDFPTHHLSFIQKLCDRKFGVGADGLILLEQSSVANFKMRIFNADGSEAEMCGNGIRCLFKFIQKLGHHLPSYSIETINHPLVLHSKGDDVSVQMANPFDIKWNQTLSINSISYPFHFMNTGVPHAVIFVEDSETISVNSLGASVRYHPFFSPKGTNVNFAHLVDNKVIVRTYERGVEAETLACGTGVTATAIAAAQSYDLSPPIQVITRSGQELTVDFVKDSEQIKNVILTGPAHLIFEGEISF